MNSSLSVRSLSIVFVNAQRQTPSALLHSKGKTESARWAEEAVKKIKTKANKPFLGVNRPLFRTTNGD